MKLASFRFYLSQLNWLVVIFTLLVFSGLIKLGLWQSERALEKELRLTRISQLNDQKAISIKQVQLLRLNGESINDIRVLISGSFDSNQIFLLDNQTNKGRLGYRVLQIVHLGQMNVMVNLGWVEGFVDRGKLPKVSPLVGEHSFLGRVRLIEKGMLLAEQNFDQITWPLRIQQIELDKISQITGQKLLPFVIYLDKKEQIGFEKNWLPVVMPPEKHRAYAFQWFSLAVAWLLLMLWASSKSTRIIHYNNKKA